MLDPVLRKELQDSLQKNKSILLNESLRLLENSFDNYYKIIIHEISFDYALSRRTKEMAKANIFNTLEQVNYPLLGYRDMFESSPFWSSELKFHVLKHQNQSPTNEQYNIQYRKRKELEIECKEYFFKTIDNQEAYKNISDFNCFTEKVYTETEFSTKLHHGFTFNINGWKDYVFRLISFHFSEYTFMKKKSSSQTLRFLKPLTEELLIGIEYDENEFKSDFRHGDPSLPSLNIVILNRKFDKNLKADIYRTGYNENILSLGPVGNPFFFPPCIPMKNFHLIELMRQEETQKYKIYYNVRSDGNYEIIYPQTYGETLKEHAFFYFHLIGYTSKGYLKYIERSCD